VKNFYSKVTDVHDPYIFQSHIFTVVLNIVPLKLLSHCCRFFKAFTV
jgi:hypothetical protein